MRTPFGPNAQGGYNSETVLGALSMHSRFVHGNDGMPMETDAPHDDATHLLPVASAPSGAAAALNKDTRNGIRVD